MQTLIEELKEQLMMKGYSTFSEPETHEEDGTTIFLATGDEKIVYVKVFDKGADLSFEVQDAALIEAQYHEEAPDFIWASNGEVNYYADCIESDPLAEIPAVIEVTKKKNDKFLNKKNGQERCTLLFKSDLMICMNAYMDRVGLIISAVRTKPLMN